jgi:hypothetical protein
MNTPDEEYLVSYSADDLKVLLKHYQEQLVEAHEEVIKIAAHCELLSVYIVMKEKGELK